MVHRRKSNEKQRGVVGLAELLVVVGLLAGFASVLLLFVHGTVGEGRVHGSAIAGAHSITRLFERLEADALEARAASVKDGALELERHDGSKIVYELEGAWVFRKAGNRRDLAAAGIRSLEFGTDVEGLLFVTCIPQVLDRGEGAPAIGTALFVGEGR